MSFLPGFFYGYNTTRISEFPLVASTISTTSFNGNSEFGPDRLPTVGIPSGTTAGDLLVAVVSSRGTGTAPSGWTAIESPSSAGFVFLRFWYKVAGSSESTITLSGSFYPCSVTTYRITRHSSAVEGTAENDEDTGLVTPSWGTTRKTLWLAGAAQDHFINASTPSGYGSRINNGPSDSWAFSGGEDNVLSLDHSMYALSAVKSAELASENPGSWAGGGYVYASGLVAIRGT